MDEFANKVRVDAAKALRQTFGQAPSRETDPVVELIACLLEDGAGGVLSPAKAQVTTEEWLDWNHLVMREQRKLFRTIKGLLERERIELPTETEAMRNWAASVLLSTLDQMKGR